MIFVVKISDGQKQNILERGTFTSLKSLVFELWKRTSGRKLFSSGNDDWLKWPKESNELKKYRIGDLNLLLYKKNNILHYMVYDNKNPAGPSMKDSVNVWDSYSFIKYLRSIIGVYCNIDI